MMNYLWIAVSGLAAGLLSGLLGVGGGALLVPVFIYLFKMDVHVAVGTSLAVIVPTALAGSLRYLAGHSIDGKMVLWISIFSIVGALLGAHVSLGLAAPVVKKLFAVFLFVLSLYIYFG